MSANSLLEKKHLLLRAGFGLRLDQLKNTESSSIKEIWRELKKDKSFRKIGFDSPAVEYDYQLLAKLDAPSKKEITQRNRKQTLEINLNFLNEMVNSEDQLREKMSFFWHGHFATRIQRADMNAQLLNTIREKCLENFKDLLFSVSQAPAMLQFLNNQQNKKDHPNENFAREVMELFTMGRGNYTETDIKESARAFTGWGFDREGTFKFRKNQHDNGVKTFLGKSGNFDGKDILNIILEQKATSRFIVTKIYKFFVNEIPDTSIIEQLSQKFYNSGYDIKKLMDDIFTSSWFYEEKNIGTKIKSPIELIVGIMRSLPMDIGNRDNLIVYQKLLGQMLLFPPNVAGWPSGTSWIDSSTLLLRMQLPQIWSGLRPLNLKPKADDDLDMGINDKRQIGKFFKDAKIIIDWARVESLLPKNKINEVLLQKPLSVDVSKLNEYTDQSVKMNIINIMSTPEYQLC